MSRLTQLLDGEEERILERLGRALSSAGGDATLAEVRASRGGIRS